MGPTGRKLRGPENVEEVELEKEKEKEKEKERRRILMSYKSTDGVLHLYYIRLHLFNLSNFVI